MQKYKLLGAAALAILSLLSVPRPAYAYLDPGTTGSIFAFLGPLLVMFLGFLGFMIRPIRSFFASIGTKLRGGSKAGRSKSDEPESAQMAAENQSDKNSQ